MADTLAVREVMVERCAGIEMEDIPVLFVR